MKPALLLIFLAALYLLRRREPEPRCPTCGRDASYPVCSDGFHFGYDDIDWLAEFRCERLPWERAA